MVQIWNIIILWDEERVEEGWEEGGGRGSDREVVGRGSGDDVLSGQRLQSVYKRL